MAITVTHAKTNTINDWTQAELNTQIAAGNYPPGTVLNDVVLPSDWNHAHTVTGIGTVTVGVSDGTFSVSDYGGNARLAIEAALAASTSIIILPGTYTLTAPVSINTTSAIEIQGSGNPVLVINHSSSVGAFSVVTTGNMVIEGIAFQINTWVASQQIIAIAPPGGTFESVNCQIRDNTFTFGTGVENDFAPTFSPGNEMIGFMITQGVSCEIDNNTVYPNKGVTGIKLLNGFGNIVERNKIKNASVFYFPTIPDSLRRPCYIGVDSQSETATIIRSNIFQSLGLIDASPPRVDRRLTHALRVQIPNTLLTSTEYGHGVLQNNVFDDCLTDTTCVVDLRGPRWLVMSGGYFCFNGTATALGSGFVRVTDANADRTGTNAYAYQCQIVGVHFHNSGTTQSACIYVNSATDLAIQSCTFHEIHSTAVIQVDPGAVANNIVGLTITGCKASWPSTSPTSRFLIQRTGSTANAAKDLFVGDTVCSSGDSTHLVNGIYTGTIFAEKHCINGIVDSAGVAVGYTISTNNYLLGQTGSAAGVTGINLQGVLDQGNSATADINLTGKLSVVGGTSTVFAGTLDGTATAGTLDWLDFKSAGVSYGTISMTLTYFGVFSSNGVFCGSSLSNYILITGGSTSYVATGTHTFTGAATFNGLTTMTAGLVLNTVNLALTNVNVALSTGTGTKFGTGATEKLSFWNATPIVQPANTVAIDTLLVNTGLRATGGTANFDTALKSAVSLQTPAIVNDTGLAAGTYTPTLTNVANVDASTAYQCQYLRVGNSVTVSGKIDIDPTTTNTLTRVGISLPIASNFANEQNCAGSGCASTVSREPIAIRADATNDRAEVACIMVTTANQSFFFTFTYTVI